MDITVFDIFSSPLLFPSLFFLFNKRALSYPRFVHILTKKIVFFVHVFFSMALIFMFFQNWMSYLQSLRIEFREDFSLPDYLISPETILDWHNVKELPNDVLCDENAVMLTRFNRYPLIVDPSGQGSRFLLNLYPDMETTSFLSSHFSIIFFYPLLFFSFYTSLFSPLLFALPLT